MNLIREIYNGGLIPADSVGRRSEKYSLIREQAYIAQQNFIAKLDWRARSSGTRLVTF